MLEFWVVRMPASLLRSSPLKRLSLPLLAGFLLLAHPVYPQSFEEVSRRADEARSRGELNAAVDAYRVALDLQPDWQEGWWYLGTILYDQYRYEEARDAFRRLAAQAPKNGPAFALLGLCEYQARNYEQALISLQKARLLGVGDNAQLRSVV